jgi:hypothetical protein
VAEEDKDGATHGLMREDRGGLGLIESGDLSEHGESGRVTVLSRGK